MHVTSADSRRSLAFGLAAVLVLSLVLQFGPLGSRAEANHPADSCLDLHPETERQQAGGTHTVTATLREIGSESTPNPDPTSDQFPFTPACDTEVDTSGTPPIPTDEPNTQTAPATQAGGPVVINFEIIGPNDPDGGDTPNTIDRSCTIAVGQHSCQINYTPTKTGTDTIRGWVAGHENDSDEALDENDTDTSDAVTRETVPGPPATLDCDDQTGPDTENEVNPHNEGAQSNEQYTCEVKDQFGNPTPNDPDDPDEDDDTVQTVEVRGENESGVNDQDSADDTSYNTPDYTCTPDAQGRCTVNVGQSENEQGTAVICFWVDSPNTNNNGAALCADEPTNESLNNDGTDTGNDRADQVEKRWEQREVAGVDAEPETDVNSFTQSHTVTATVYDQFGQPLNGNHPVNFEFFNGSPSDTDNGNNPSNPDRSCNTAGSSSCSISYTQSTTAGTDLICAYLGTDEQMTGTSPSGTCDGEDLNDPDDDPGNPDAPQNPARDDQDVVAKQWQSTTAPSRLDCSPETDSNPTGSSHSITCTARNDAGNTIANTQIDAEASGANDPDNADNRQNPDFGCTTGNDGTCSFTHGGGGQGGNSNSAGQTTYRIWIDADGNNTTDESDPSEGRDEGPNAGGRAEPDNTDVVAKTWVGIAENLTMTPESDSARVGTCNPYTITVTDNANQPLPGIVVDVEQTHTPTGNQPASPVAFCTPTANDGPNPSGVNQGAGDRQESPDNPSTAGGETTTPTDAAGKVTIGITITQTSNASGAGTVKIDAFVDEGQENDDPDPGEPLDSSTKTWFPNEGRFIDCSPETATNPVGTQHVVTCTVTDQQNQPISGEGVTFTSEGTGQLSTTQQTTDNAGQARATATSATAGTQSITGTISDDTQGSEPSDVDECDRANNDPSGNTAGICADSVSKTWVQQSPSSLNLTPARATNRPGTTHELTATVTDAQGSPVEGAAVTWRKSGSGRFVTTETTTDASGQANATIRSDQKGRTDVTATASGCAQGGDCTDTAVKNWGPRRCDIFGTSGRDVLRGTGAAETICGFGNDDTIVGRGGNDVILGGWGHDLIKGGNGGDTVFGSRGNDDIAGNRGGDRLRGGRGRDDLIGGIGNDNLKGNRGNDDMNGGRGRDRCAGGGGRDTAINCERVSSARRS